MCPITDILPRVLELGIGAAIGFTFIFGTMKMYERTRNRKPTDKKKSKLQQMGED